MKCTQTNSHHVGRPLVEKADQRYCSLLRAYGERPGYGSTTKKCDEFPSPHAFARAEDRVGYAK
jgi:hypothetical protein